MKRVSIFITVICLAVLISACTFDEQNPLPTPVVTPTTSQTLQPSASPTVSNTEPPTNNIITTGTYVGLIDNNSFEVIIDGNPMAFWHTDSQSLLESNNVHENDTIQIEYFTNSNGQNIPVAITVIDNEDTQAISDYFPIRANVLKQYQGVGNEYAAYTSYSELTSSDKTQLKIDNGGTVSVRVYQITPDAVVLKFMQGEVYDEENHLDEINTDEVILKAPITVGTNWVTNNDVQNTITAIGKTISTPYSDFEALEITSVSKHSTTYYYYVKDIGHVKTVFVDNETNTEITSSLEKMTID